MLVAGGISSEQALSFVNWPTVCLLFGFFVISAQLRLSGFYDMVAGVLGAWLDHPKRFLAILMAATGGLSAFLNHDIVCFVFTPVVAMALLRKGLNPIPFLVALAVSSNIGAAATLIGNAQDMMIGEVARLNFGAYMLWSAPPTLFAMVAAFVIILWMSRDQFEGAKVQSPASTFEAYEYNKAHTIKGLVILAAVVGLFFTSLPKEGIALAAAGIHLASPKFRTEDLLRLVDWPILILFVGLFVVTGAFQTTGYCEQGAHWLARSGLDLNAPPVLALVTAGLSNLIGNSAAVMLLVKVADLTHPTTGYVLALANSFGGSLILVGSVANIIVAQQARDLGIDISLRQFSRLGRPVTLASLGGLLAWAAVAG